MIHRIPLLALLAALLAAGPRPAAAAAAEDSLAGAALQKDGKAILVGETDAGGTTDWAVARLAADGSLDPSFGEGGRVVMDLGGTDEGLAAAVDRRKRIMVAGGSNASGSYDWVVARLKPDGSLDPSFGTGGKVVADMGGPNDAPFAVAVDRKGRILVCGWANPEGNFHWAVARFTPEGVLDATFAEGGRFLRDFGGFDYASALIVDRKGFITVVGTSNLVNDFIALRLDDSGDLDPSFGGDGIATVDFGGADASHALAPGKKGTLVLAGTTSSGGAFAIARLLKDGAPDATFDGDGKATVAFPDTTTATARSVALDSKGRIHAGGFSTGLTGAFAAARLTAAGGLDDTFGTGGRFTSSPTGLDYGRRMLLGRKGTVLLAGDAQGGGSSDMGVLRLDRNGDPDPSFNGGDPVLVDF